MKKIYLTWIHVFRYLCLIKIDVEGAEYMVLDGCRNLLKNKIIKAGQFEVGIEESGFSTNDIINLLKEFDYNIEITNANDYFFYK